MQQPQLTSATVVGTAVKLNFSESSADSDVVLTNSLFIEYSTDAWLYIFHSFVYRQW